MHAQVEALEVVASCDRPTHVCLRANSYKLTAKSRSIKDVLFFVSGSTMDTHCSHSHGYCGQLKSSGLLIK